MNRSRIATIDELVLPASLERIGGDIRVAGHRASLYHILDATFDEAPIGRIREMFPTIPPGTLDEVIAFSERHPELMREYHAVRRAGIGPAVGRAGTAPTLSELRRRKVERVGPIRRNG